MQACPSCSAEVTGDARFCPNCGARLTAPVALAQERKVITALFCDLVGFTATSEGADPEDVDRMLTRYFTMARGQIEAFSGVVEKFIGDAVVGVFGVPAAHEDDPERAVRAALRICEDAADLPALGDGRLRLRIGINTGEALVRLDVAPGAGERFLAGDTINTASRIQSVAPEMGVAVGAATFEATRSHIDFEELPPATLKGKSAPVRLFHAVAPISRLGTDVSRSPADAFVGRDAEMRHLADTFEAAVASGSMRFLTIVGDAGMGKSRLVSQLLAHVDALPRLVTWRQGRCLPYGRGVSFWAVGEIVKAHAGILDSDSMAVAVGKLDAVLPMGDERAWLRERLLPLIGVEVAADSPREEQFTAWRRFIASIAEARPTVIIMEDLHWAEEPMREFLEELARNPIAAPLLVIGTARPELDDGDSEFLADVTSVARIVLAPLSPDDARRLVSNVFEVPAVAPDLVEHILERSNGNPLFVEEFVRLLRDRDLVESHDGMLRLRPGAALPVPGGLTALLSARLDALPVEQKSTLADASVLGKVFWAGAIQAMGDRAPLDVDTALMALTRKEFIRLARDSTMNGEMEYIFWHVMARDVAYGALPRSARAARHAAAAKWIESKVAGRVDDVAAILAHHYVTALDLATATGDAEQAAALQGPALRFLTLAGERALGVDVPVAIPLLERALELAPVGDVHRADVLDRYGQALYLDGHYQAAVHSYEEAIATHRAAGDLPAVGLGLGRLASTLRTMGDTGIRALTQEAVDILEPGGPTPELADAIARRASHDAIEGRVDEAIDGLERALAIAGVAPYPENWTDSVSRERRSGSSGSPARIAATGRGWPTCGWHSG